MRPVCWSSDFCAKQIYIILASLQLACANPATFAFAVYPIKWSSSHVIDGSSSILRIRESEFFDNSGDELRERHRQRAQPARSPLWMRLTQRDEALRSVDGVALEAVRLSVRTDRRVGQRQESVALHTAMVAAS